MYIDLDNYNGEREPWNSRSEKAKSLKIDDFGLADEVVKMAQMPRTAKDRAETINIL